MTENSFGDSINLFDSKDWRIRKMEEFFLWCDFQWKNNGILPSTQNLFFAFLCRELGKCHNLHKKNMILPLHVFKP